MINLLMLMNDFVETDKIGSLFFLSAAAIVAVDLNNKRDLMGRGSIVEDARI